jgi:hypothetical protein
MRLFFAILASSGLAQINFNDHNQLIAKQRRILDKTSRETDYTVEGALKECTLFYEEREDSGIVSAELLGGGGQSRVYKCETDTPDYDLPVVVAKMYMRPYEVKLLNSQCL